MTDSAHLDKVAERMARVFHEAFTSGYMAPTWEELSDAQREKRSAAQRAVITDLQLTEEWGVQISYGEQVISDNPMDLPMAEAVVRRNHTGNAHVASRLVSAWVRVDGGDA